MKWLAWMKCCCKAGCWDIFWISAAKLSCWNRCHFGPWHRFQHGSSVCDESSFCCEDVMTNYQQMQLMNVKCVIMDRRQQTRLIVWGVAVFKGAGEKRRLLGAVAGLSHLVLHAASSAAGQDKQKTQNVYFKFNQKCFLFNSLADPCWCSSALWEDDGGTFPLWPKCRWALVTPYLIFLFFCSACLRFSVPETKNTTRSGESRIK